MANVKVVIDSRFDNLTILELLNYYHLGKEKIKKVKFYLNDNLVDKYKELKLNDVLVLEYDDQIDFLPDNKKLKILYEDENLLIVDKPIGMLVHPDSKDKRATLVNIVSNYYHITNQNISVKYLHRIDMDTSGIVVFAKDILTASIIGEEIKNHTFIRRYLCIASGRFDSDSGIYNYPIAENRYIANKKRVSPTGKEAITHFKVLERYKNATLIEPLTMPLIRGNSYDFVVDAVDYNFVKNTRLKLHLEKMLTLNQMRVKILSKGDKMRIVDFNLKIKNFL